MARYKLTETELIIRTSDGAVIPNDPDNRDRAEYDGWLADGGIPDPYVRPLGEPSFFARDLMVQLTPDDYAKIQAAVASNAALGLLWASLLAQGDAPIRANAERFQQGWLGLTEAIGEQRAEDISAALGISG